MLYTRTIKEYQVPTRRALSRQFLNPNMQSAYLSPWGWQQQPQHLIQCSPEADVLELDDQFLLEIALPGVVLDDVELKAEENCVTVIARRTFSAFEERAVFLRKELPAGYFVRQFEFDTPVLHEQIQARMDRGILFVSVPKLEIAQRIPVSAGTIDVHAPALRTSISSKGEARGKEVTAVK